MDLTGTSVAQGVAGVTHTAQQIARARDRRDAERERAVRRVRDAFEAHLRSLEESDQDQAAPRLHVDDRLPERSIADEMEEQRRRVRRSPSDLPDSAAESADEDVSAGALYRHLDLTA